MTGVSSARANAPVDAAATPSSAPSRAMSVWMIAAAPASSKRRASSSASMSTVSAQPSTATRPSRASMPTATRPGKARQASRTRSGSRTATVPRITRRTPRASHASIVAMSLNAAAQLHGQIDRFEDRPDRVIVDRLAGEGAVEIDDVKPGEAGGCEGPRLRRGIVGEDRGPRHVALHEPDASAPLEVDRREEDHGAGSGGRSVRSVRSLQ